MAVHAFSSQTKLPAERRQFILDCLIQSGRVSVAELCGILQVSEDTIRRDLRDLDQAGLLRRVHGGALLPTLPSETFAARLRRHSPAKEALAGIAADLIQTGQVVLIDSGTTMLEVARSLAPGFRATFISTSPPIAATLADKGIEVHMLPGRVHPEALAVVGAETVAALRRLRAHLCLIGVCSLHAEAGLTAHHPEEAATKQAMIESAGEVVAVATTEKLGSVAPFFVTEAERVDILVTERAALEENGPAASLRASGIRILTP